MALGKAGKQRSNFPDLPSARAMALGKEFSKKKRKNSLPSAAEVGLGKEAVRVDVEFFFFAEC